MPAEIKYLLSENSQYPSHRQQKGKIFSVTQNSFQKYYYAKHFVDVTVYAYTLLLQVIYNNNKTRKEKKIQNQTFIISYQINFYTSNLNLIPLTNLTNKCQTLKKPKFHQYQIHIDKNTIPIEKSNYNCRIKENQYKL